MTNLFIIFAVSLAGGVAAILTAMLVNALYRKPEKDVTLVYFATFDNGLWHVYYDDPSLVEPMRIATFTDYRDVEHLLTRVERYHERTPGPVNEPAVKIDDYCDARR